MKTLQKKIAVLCFGMVILFIAQASAYENRSYVYALHPIASALSEAQTFLPNTQLQLVGTNPDQNEFIKLYDALVYDRNTGIPEMKSIGSVYSSVVNNFLRVNGFSIQLDPWQPTEGFGLAAVMKIYMDWIEPGTKGILSVQQGSTDNYTRYSGVTMKNNRGVSFYTSNQTDFACIKATDQKTEVCMGIIPNKEVEPNNVFSVTSAVLALDNKKIATSNKYKKLIFPMVDLDKQPDISWLIGMSWFVEEKQRAGHAYFTTKSKHSVSQAQEQVRFQMDEIGARIEAGVVVRVAKGIDFSPTLIIDKPFLLWVKREGFKFPILAGWITESVWKDPKNRPL